MKEYLAVILFWLLSLLIIYSIIKTHKRIMKKMKLNEEIKNAKNMNKIKGIQSKITEIEQKWEKAKKYRLIIAWIYVIIIIIESIINPSEKIQTQTVIEQTSRLSNNRPVIRPILWTIWLLWLGLWLVGLIIYWIIKFIKRCRER